MKSARRRPGVLFAARPLRRFYRSTVPSNQESDSMAVQAAFRHAEHDDYYCLHRAG
jgi:hypothetical protein